MKQRYYKYLGYGFKNLKGLPEKIEDRFKEINDDDIKIPLPKIKENSKTYPFFFNNLEKLFKN